MRVVLLVCCDELFGWWGVDKSMRQTVCTGGENFEGVRETGCVGDDEKVVGVSSFDDRFLEVERWFRKIGPHHQAGFVHEFDVIYVFIDAIEDIFLAVLGCLEFRPGGDLGASLWTSHECLSLHCEIELFLLLYCR